MTEILSKMRRSVELFSRSLDACDEPNESRIVLVDFLDCMATILLDMNKYLHDCLSGMCDILLGASTSFLCQNSNPNI